MSSESLMYQNQWLQEASTWYYTLMLKDELGNAVGSSQIDTLTLTFYSRDTPDHPAILDWTEKNVKAANGGTVSTTGKFELRLTDADTILLNSTRRYELRGLLLTWKTITGKTFRHEVHTAIANLAKVG
jgi:hypothetical protein